MTELTISNAAADRVKVLEAVETLAAEHQFRPKAAHELQLALEEHLTNIASYGYDDAGCHAITIRFTLAGQALNVQIEDDGRPFNPLLQPTPDLSLPIDERPLGGLGIHMIRKSVDALEYRREGARNVLVMTKNV